MPAIQILDQRSSVWQWDTGVKIKVYGCTDVDQMHFETPEGLISRSVVENECDVPDSALRNAGILKMYAYDRNEAGGITRNDFNLWVRARPKPADYIDPPDEYDNLEELAKRIAPLIPGGGGSVTPEQIGAAVEEYLAENPIEGKPGPQGPQGIQGEPGQRGEQGPPGADGSDATVTAENVTAALGYTPADKETVESLSQEIENKNGNVTPQMFGAKGDGATDDTDAIQAAINSGGTVYLPAGRYKITRTLFLRTGTTLMGTGDSSVIFLGDNGANLTPHDWYINSTTFPRYYPYITTQEGAKDIRISRIRLEGNLTESSANLHVGICVESAENVQIDYVTVYKINYFPDEAPPRPSGQWRTGWNVGVLRSSRVEIANCTVQYGGYECVRIGTDAHDVWVHDSLIEYGWRTGLQVIEDCSHVAVERCTINQDDFDKYDTNACITFHPSDNHIGGDFWIRACRLNARGLFNSDAGGGAINVVWNHISNLFVEDTIIDANGNGLPLIHLKGNTTIRGCTLTAGADTNAITTNSGDGREFTVLVEDSIITSTDASRPTFAMYCNSKFHRCKITSAKTCIYTVDEGEVGIYLQVSESELHASASGNAIQIINKSNVTSPDGKVAFDIFNNNLDGKIYIAQANKVIDRKCSITNNTIIAPSGQSCIQNDYSSTEFKLLTIRDNVMSGGSNAVKLWGAGLAVIEGNNMTGCNAGIEATNERNIIKDNFLPG